MMATNVAAGLEIEREDGARAETLRPVSWEEWITLPIREQDEAAHTVRGDSCSHCRGRREESWYTLKNKS
jgi:hypothetical protein